MTTFYLIRHAEKASDPDVLTGRSPGVPLSAAGRRQVERLAERFTGVGLRRVVSSPMERARETAKGIARATRVEVEISKGLNEVDFGLWTGRRCADLEPDPLWRQFNAFRSGTRIPEGETMVEVQARLVGEMLRWAETEPEGAVVLVSHGDPIKCALTYFAGATVDAWERFEIAPASVTTIEIGVHGARILGVNDRAGIER